MAKAKPKTMSLKEAAERLGVSVPVARRAAAKGQLPALKVGRTTLILREPFLKILEAGVRPSMRDPPE